MDKRPDSPEIEKPPSEFMLGHGVRHKSTQAEQRIAILTAYYVSKELRYDKKFIKTLVKEIREMMLEEINN